MILTYFQDPGHGWLRINHREAQRIMGESFSKITPFSYQKNEWIYLEEDCDAGLLIKALKALKDQGIEYQIKEKHSNNHSTIRSYSSFAA